MLPTLPDYPIDYSTDNDRAGRRYLPALVAVLLLVAVVGLAATSWHQHVSSIDRSVTAGLVQRDGSSAFVVADDVSIVGSGPAVGAFALLFGAVIWLRMRNACAALLAPVASVVAGIVEATGKVIVGHPRPSLPVSLVNLGLDSLGAHDRVHRAGPCRLATARRRECRLRVRAADCVALRPTGRPPSGSC